MDSSIWFWGFFASVLLFQLVAIPALILKKNDLADVLWGPAFPLCALLSLVFSGTDFSTLDARKVLVLALLTLWAVRLFLHVGWRNLSHRQEDVRYAKWRREWGPTATWRSYLQVFVLQALILGVFLIPVLWILAHPAWPLGPWAYLGLAVWTVGLLFEAIGDEQLRRFKSDPANKGRLMTTGLWSWTRHPNYFGEVLLWWGVWLIAMEIPGAWWTIIAPLGITFLILRVSGVSMLEKLMRSRPGYEEYANSVSVFFPWPPKRKRPGLSRDPGP